MEIFIKNTPSPLEKDILVNGEEIGWLEFEEEIKHWISCGHMHNQMGIDIRESTFEKAAKETVQQLKSYYVEKDNPTNRGVQFSGIRCDTHGHKFITVYLHSKRWGHIMYDPNMKQWSTIGEIRKHGICIDAPTHTEVQQQILEKTWW